MAGKSGGKGQKIGRNKRAATAAGQKQRTERNKARNVKRTAKQAAADKDKVMAVPRGTARAAKRVGKQRSVS